MKHRPLKVAAVLAVTLAMAACSSDDKGSSAPTTMSAETRDAALRAPIADAVATRDALLELATLSTVIPNSDPIYYGGLENWKPYVDALDFSGSGIAATPTSISGFVIVLSKSKNISYLTFAVLDSAGNCAAGAVELADDVTVSKVAPIDGMTAADCSGTAASDLGGY